MSEILRDGKNLPPDASWIRHCFQNVNLGILLLNADAFIVEVNPQIEKILGFKPEQVLGARFLDLSWPMFQDDGQPLKLETLPAFEVLRTGEAVHNVMVLYEHPLMQTQRWFRVDAYPLDVSGHFATLMFQDVTEQKLAEMEIRTFNHELEQAVQRRTQELETVVAELEAFNYSVSHDLRAPLRAIEGFGQALEEDYHDRLDDEGRFFLQRIRQASQRMNLLIDDLLRLSRLSRQSLYVETVDLSSLAQEVIRNYQGLVFDRLSIDIAEHMQVKADKALLRVVLDNLFSNALKFTAKESQAHIELGSLPEKDDVVFFIKDNGVGFDMAMREKLFVPFQRLHADKAFEGHGIGLALVQRIIHRHGGRVWAEARVNDGACFYVALPC